MLSYELDLTLGKDFKHTCYAIFMLTEKQIEEIREHLRKAQNPLFFFDNDADGLCSFLILSRWIGRGKGVAIKSFPSLDENHSRKIYELNPDYVFVLDKPLISKEFSEEVRKLGLPFVWIDHHDLDVEVPEGVYYYNPAKIKEGNKNKSTEPVTYWAYKITENKEDLWLGMAGCIADNFLPDFSKNFEEKYPELWKKGVKSAFQALYETEIGRITRIMGFGLKDRTSNVVKMLKFLLKTKNPLDILEDVPSNTLLFRFGQVNKKYQKFLEKAESFAGRGKLLYFQYGGDLSLSADIANELYYRHPDKIIVVAYLAGTKANLSLRGEKVKELTAKAIEGLENSTGGGHENATGAKVQIEDLPKFKEKIEHLIN